MTQDRHGTRPAEPGFDRLLRAHLATVATATGSAGSAGATSANDANSATDATDAAGADNATDAAGTAPGSWRIVLDEPWCRAEPPGHKPRVQGWKLHVSATPLSAATMLDRCIPVLVAAGAAFKFAATPDDVHALTDPRCDRVTGGKILTVYPRDDAHSVELAEALCGATYGLPGQDILTDRRYRPDSPVHYRFGAFEGLTAPNLDGRTTSRLVAPDGSSVEDVRNPWFATPSWAPSPFDAEPARASVPVGAAPERPRAVLLDGRFEVRGAIQHSNRGGVYRAVDRETGADVVVKQARAHTGGQVNGQDSRDVLRHEARMLTALDGLAPRLVSVFEQGRDVFLAQESVAGVTVRAWIADRLEESRTDPTAVEPAAGLDLARRLTALLAEVHARGLVCRDFTPNNVMVRPDGGLTVVDVELTAREGEAVVRGYTPGFGAPEQSAAGRIGPCPGPAVDRYALGAAFFLLATGMEPLLLEDRPRPRDPADRLGARLAAMAGSPLAAALAPAIVGLTAGEPEKRWTLDQTTAFLDAVEVPTPGEPAVVATDAVVSAVRGPGPASAAPHDAPLDRMIHDGLDHLVAEMTPNARRLWAGGPFGRLVDACSVQHGSAGVLGVLVQAVDRLGREDLLGPIEQTAHWTVARLEARPDHLPGLYFGSAGAVWAVHQAAAVLKDDALADRALAVARLLPTRWPVPDMCHGVAGAGTALLALSQGAVHDDRLIAGVSECADALLAAAQRENGRITWPVPADVDSTLAGISHYGFAHGIAGIGTFLLAAAAALGRRDCADAAVEAGQTLLAAADRSAPGARWQASTEGAPTRREFHYYWCSGSSGIGTFLVRLAAATGDVGYRTVADEAALAVHRMRWISGTAACHGLAGNGEYLLDLADTAPDPSTGAAYRRWAHDLAVSLHAHHAVREGRLLSPEETGATVVADAQTGLAGTVGFLIRLTRGGPRPWLAEAAPAPTRPEGR